MWTIFDALVFAAGFAACWFSKDKIIEFATGAQALAEALESKAAALKAKL